MRYDGPSSGYYDDDEPCSLGVDAAGNVFVTGTGYGTTTGPDYITIKYDEYQPSEWAAAEAAEAASGASGSLNSTAFANGLSFLLVPVAAIAFMRRRLSQRNRGHRPSA
jgi:hypothetical protein